MSTQQTGGKTSTQRTGGTNTQRGHVTGSGPTLKSNNGIHVYRLSLGAWQVATLAFPPDNSLPSI